MVPSFHKILLNYSYKLNQYHDVVSIFTNDIVGCESALMIVRCNCSCTWVTRQKTRIIVICKATSLLKTNSLEASEEEWVNSQNHSGS